MFQAPQAKHLPQSVSLSRQLPPMRLSTEDSEDMRRQHSEIILRCFFDLRPTQKMLLSLAIANVIVMYFGL